MPDGGLKKIEKTNKEETLKCLAIIKNIWTQILGLKALNLDSLDKQYVGRLQSSLNGLLSRMQKNLGDKGQSHETKRKDPISIKQ